MELAPASLSVKQYQRKKLLGGAFATGLSLGVLCSLAFWGSVQLKPVVEAWVGPGRWLQLWMHALMLGSILEIASLPISFWSGFLVEHHYELSNQTFFGWLKKRLKSLLLGSIFGLLLLSGLYALLWATGTWWWLWATGGMLLVTLILGRLAPILILPLFYKVAKLEDVSLVERLRNLTQGTTLTLEGVYRLHLSEETKKANAALTGLGRSRRVLLGDTLLEQFTPEEIEVVFAHEVGHHYYQHLPKMVVLQAFITLTSFWLVDWILRHTAVSLGYAGLTDPAALPLVLLVMTLFGMMISPAMNALSRHFEVQCDTYALKKTGNREAFRSAFVKLAEQNKSDPDPHPLVVWLFYDHPAIRQRLTLADSVYPATK